MKIFAATAIFGIATAMTTVETISDPDLKVNVEYSVMDTDLAVTISMTPSAGVQNTAVHNASLLIATSRNLTEDEKTKTLAKDFASLENSGPASSGFSVLYMDITGLAPELANTPVEIKFEPTCSHEEEGEIPEADRATLCGWKETEPVALSED